MLASPPRYAAPASTVPAARGGAAIGKEDLDILRYAEQGGAYPRPARRYPAPLFS